MVACEVTKKLKLRHGRRSCYNTGCRHPKCVQANRDYQAQYLRDRIAAGITDRTGRVIRD